MKRKRVGFNEESKTYYFDDERDQGSEKTERYSNLYEEDEPESPGLEDKLEQHYLKMFEREFKSFGIGALPLTSQSAAAGMSTDFWPIERTNLFDQKQSEDSQKLIEASDRAVNLNSDQLSNDQIIGKEPAEG